MTTENGSTNGQPAGAIDPAVAALQGQQQTDGAARADAIQNGQATFSVPADVLEWGKSKGYKPEQMAKVFAENPDMYSMANSYRNAEKLLGGDKLIIPKDQTDQAGWDALYNKLGRPEKADAYKLPDLPDTATPEFTDWAKNTFYKVGISQQQSEMLSKEWMQMMQATVAKDDAEMKASAVKQQAELEKEWAADLKGNTEVARRANVAMAKDIGLDGTDLDAMEKALGLRKSLKIMNYVGRSLKLDSDTYEGAGDTNRGGGIKSVEAAKSEKEALFNDPSFVKKFNDKDQLARAKIAALNGIISQANPNYSGQ